MTEIITKKLKQPLTKLTPQMEQALSLLVHGIEYRDSRIDGGDHPLGVPLGINQVADLLKVRRAYVRDLMSDALFKTKYNQAVADVRGSEQPAIIANLAAIAKTPVLEPKGSEVIAAAKLLMGEDSKGFSVNVQVNNQTNIANAIRPGYVLDLGAMHGRRHEDPPIIEGKVE